MSDVVGVGVDCESISRFKDKNDLFFKKNFTEKERKYCSGKANPAQHFAARFAAKEAIIKAFSAAGKNVFFSEIEILNMKNGAPKASILKKNLSEFHVKLSMSHSNGMAIAFAVLTK